MPDRVSAEEEPAIGRQMTIRRSGVTARFLLRNGWP